MYEDSIKQPGEWRRKTIYDHDKSWQVSMIVTRVEFIGWFRILVRVWNMFFFHRDLGDSPTWLPFFIGLEPPARSLLTQIHSTSQNINH